MKQSGKVFLALIALTLISSLYCRENSSSQAPLIGSSVTDSGSIGSTRGTDTNTPASTGEPVVDGIIPDDGTASATAAASSATPTVTDINTLVKLVPDAENALFTDTGRLFVTGNTAIYEITGRTVRTAVYKDFYGVFGGIAQSGKWLYVICNTTNKPLAEIDLCSIFTSGDIISILNELTDAFMYKQLLRADLSVPGSPAFTLVHTFKDTMLLNGMAADADGNLYIADQTFLPMGKIIKVSMTGDSQPAVTEETWISYNDGCLSPNGICISGNTLYFTDFSLASTKPAKVKKVGIINGKPGTVETVYSAASFFDDLDVGTYRGQTHIALSDYLMNSIILINESDGSRTRLGSGSFANPSSVHFGKGPQFETNELIVTEKGLLYEIYSSYGNKLSCLTISE